MKKFISLLLILLFSISLFAQNRPKQVPGTEGQKTHEEARLNSTIPIFQFATHDGKFIKNTDLPKNKPVIMALFSPTCDHCQQAIVAIKNKMESFKNATIVFVCSINSYSEMQHFVQVTDAGNVPNIKICAAQDNFITKFFMPNWILPQVMVFNPQHKLKKIFYETISTDSLLTYMTKR